MSRKRVISFIDGFNLYHAIANLQRPELKWINLKALSQVFIKSHSEELKDVYYFSAFADHISEKAQTRQRAYIKALEFSAVKPILGHFKMKNKKCPHCHYKWIGHEEKETDVNIALFLIDLAYQDAFDRALVMSNDSDLTPAIKLIRKRFPSKEVTTIAPPHSFHSNELIQASTDKSKIRIEHLERSLLPATIKDSSGSILIFCPEEYMRKLATIKN